MRTQRQTDRPAQWCLALLPVCATLNPMRRLIALFVLSLLSASPMRADPVAPDLAALLSAMDRADAPRAAFLDRLDAALDRFQPAMEAPLPAAAEGDGYFWAIEARFGLSMAGTRAPGGVLTCARYGRITLERLQAVPSSDPAVFPLMRQAAILHDDAQAWPEQAVARLACLITWDDARRVAPLDPAGVLSLLADRFSRISHGPDPGEQPGGVRVFGPGGYVISARDGPADLIRVVDRAEISQTGTHQLIVLRSYLLGGGV